MTALADVSVAHAGPAAVPGAVPAVGQSGAVRDQGKTMRSWPLLVLAVPAAAEVWSGWVGIAPADCRPAALGAAGPTAGAGTAQHGLLQ
jgi:hypothetical protein